LGVEEDSSVYQMAKRVYPIKAKRVYPIKAKRVYPIKGAYHVRDATRNDILFICITCG
jgi:hypothetical protein